MQDVYIHGGDTKIEVLGNHVAGVSGESFNMTGGTIEAHTRGDYTLSSALEFVDALVTGGEGVFIAESNGVGGLWEWPEEGSFRVVGGWMIFASENAALNFSTDQTMIPDVNDRILVSTNPTGAGKFLWDSSKGILASNNVEDSEFNYVEFNSGSIVDQPVTGDTSCLWLWAGIGLLALAGGAGASLFLRRKRA